MHCCHKSLACTFDDYILKKTFQISLFQIDFKKMFKIDKFSFDCDQCKQLLIDPVSTPCGKFICKSHLDTFMKNTANERNTFVCEMCKEEHPLPHEGFVLNNPLHS